MPVIQKKPTMSDVARLAGVGTMTVTRAQSIRAVFQLLNRRLHALCRIRRNAHRSAQHARYGHGAHARQTGHIAHGGLLLNNRHCLFVLRSKRR